MGKRQNQFFCLNIKNVKKRRGREEADVSENKENTKVRGKRDLDGAWREAISAAGFPNAT